MLELLDDLVETPENFNEKSFDDISNSGDQIFF